MATAVRKRKSPAETSPWPIVLRLPPALNLTEDQFFELCQINHELRIERSAEGELLIMPPAGGETGDRESEINMQLRLWAKREGTGRAFGSATGFILPNSAVRGPDAAWVSWSRLGQIPQTQWARFLPLCPDFVIEVRSPSDRLRDVQAKMQEYAANGVRLGWLIDPEPRHIYIYRPGAPVERLDSPESISGDPVLPSFVLDLREVWAGLAPPRSG
jgi:Uma2 family endonuclease